MVVSSLPYASAAEGGVDRGSFVALVLAAANT